LLAVRQQLLSFSVNHVCPFNYCTRKYEVLQNKSRFTPCICVGKNWKKEKSVSTFTCKPQNSSKILIVSQSIHRVEKKTHLDREKPLKSDILFLNWNSDNHGQKSWHKFAFLALLPTCQTQIKLHLLNLAPHPTYNVVD